MGKQKPNPARHSKKSTAASSSVTQSATGGIASGSTSPQPEPSVAFSTIKLEYERALQAVKSGNHNKALKLMKELVSRYNNPTHSAWIHRFQSIIYGEICAIIDDPSTKKEHEKTAIQSARKAVELSPCSLKFSYYYAKLLFGKAIDWTEYEQVVKECERALEISDPIDPAEQSLKKDESQQKLSTPEARIAHVQDKLRKLIESSNLASLATNEVQLAASSSRSGKRRKSGGHVRKEAGSTYGMRDLVGSYWKSMTIDSKKGFLKIGVCDLKSHFGSPEDIWLNPNDILEDALRFGVANNKTWKYWLCCYCLNKRFPDSKSLTQHVRNIHLMNLLPETQSVLPQNVDNLTNVTQSQIISLNEDASCLVLDECLVPAEISVGATDAFITWIFSGSSCRDELDSFKKRKQDRRLEGIELIRTLEKEVKHLQSLCETQFEQKNYEEALQMVEDLSLKGKEMENFTELVLKVGKEELIKSDNDFSNRFKLEAIKNVLKEAREMMNASQSGEEDDEDRIKNYFREMDSYVEIAIQEQKKIQSLKLEKTDTQIMTSVTKVKLLELKLEPASAFDFCETLLPIVKSYLRARLKDLAEKEATKKSDASAQELLDLLASQQDVAKPQESDKKTKDKGKKKQKEKIENLKKKKATHDHEQPIEDSTTTPGSSSAVHDDDKVKDDDEKDEEEELGLRQKELEQEIGELVEKLEDTMLEEEEKTRLNEKLSQKLELQTQLSNEASMMQHGWQQI